ncbi:MAG: adenylate/guanylate cyclase domain-containing protein [Lachnospiraceae bacterium]|nr:adenylate/guanylate cyclase domain-containing protein [Lachnospiraceae bacterium]
MKSKRERILFVAVAVIIALATFGLSVSNVLYSFDKIFSDALYQVPSSTNTSIKIIAIDEETLAEYGKYEDWSRQIPADLINLLTEDENFAPAAIGLDVLYVSETDEESDDALATACKNAADMGVTVVSAANVVYKTDVTKSADGTLSVDKEHVDLVEMPYEKMRENVTVGFANAMQDVDGYIRYAKTTETYEGEIIDSFPVAIYKAYCDKNGIEANLPKTYGSNLFGFTYSGKSGGYEVLSLSEVLNGNVSSKAFANSIVLFGAYAPGMGDAYNVPVQKGVQMYGVEIHANVIEAIMEGKTNVPVNTLLVTLIFIIIAIIFYVICDNVKIVPATVLLIAFIVLDLLCGKLLHMKGLNMNLIVLPIILIAVYAYLLVTGYLVEWLKRRQTIDAFKKYVAPQVVDEISKKGEFNIVLGGENRDIAVLFVDIRGFTPMSEGLEPEQVVSILNEYLSLTTNSIFKNNGTLDKFVGDATMAVFNAPFDLDDYVYRAVCTARDIASGSDELEKKLMERFGKSVSFGIGVNCGPAVVGNIGCEFRMDYTAIGDTVNTAARLEANAKRGQILISDKVYERVKDRLKVTPIGAIPLKGKSNEVFVYQVDEVL